MIFNQTNNNGGDVVNEAVGLTMVTELFGTKLYAYVTADEARRLNKLIQTNRFKADATEGDS